MTVKYLTKNKQLQFELEGSTQKDLFEKLASIQDIFDAEHSCGVCGCSDIKYMVRTVDVKGKPANYYHLSCRAVGCYARFDFGQSMGVVGMLFPKRKDKDGTYLPNRGWTKYGAAHTSNNDDEGVPY